MRGAGTAMICTMMEDWKTNFKKNLSCAILNPDCSFLESFLAGWLAGHYPLKGLSHEIYLKNVDENGQFLALLRAAADF